MLTRAFLSKLHCPYCEAPLVLETDLSAGDEALNWGIARCACYRYPILDGILVLQQHSPAFNTANGIVDLLDAGNRTGALAYALNATSPVPGPRSLVMRGLELLERRGFSIGRSFREERDAHRRIVDDPTVSFYDALRALRPPTYADYLFYRHANPSFLASIPLLAVFDTLSGGAVLDLACGVGHTSFMIRHLFPQLDVVSADHDLVNLYLARRYVSPDLTYICLNTEHPLPFPDEMFAGVWCLDGMHYVRSKVALGRDLKRVTEPAGFWLFPHLHNALVPNLSPGIPLSPDDYRRCFEPLNPRLFVEADVFKSQLDGKPLDLSARPSDETLRHAPVVSLVAGKEDVWRSYEGLVERVWQAGGLQINPIYQARRGGSAIELTLRWPSEVFRDECGASAESILKRVEMSHDLYQRLLDDRLEAADQEQIVALIQSFVLLPLPEGYKRSTAGLAV